MANSPAIRTGLYGALQVAGQAVAAGGEQILTASGLSSLADGTYLVDVSITNNTGGAVSVHLCVNGDTTVTNYYRQISFSDGGATTAIRQNNNHFYTSITAGASMAANGFLRVLKSGHAYFAGFGNSEVPSAMTQNALTIAYNVVAPVTSLSVRSGTAATFAVGDYIRVYKIGAPSKDSGVITVTFDGGGEVLTVGTYQDIGPVGYAYEIQDVYMLADVEGSAVVNVWGDTYSNYPPLVADNIAGANPPTLTAALKSYDTALVGWSPSVPIGKILRFTLASCTSVKKLTLTLGIIKS